MSGLGLHHVLLGALIASAAWSRIADARVFTVNTTADAVDANPGDGVCRTAANTCTLRAAIQEANAFAGPDRINVPAGTFALALNGAGENAAATGDLDVTSSIAIWGISSAATIIDASGLAPRDRVFHVLAGPLELHQLRVTGGRGLPDGGGILDQGARVTLDQVEIRGCSANGDGGGIYTAGDTARVEITSSTITANSATSGGGIANEDQSTVSISDTTLSNNTAAQSGGGLYNHIAGGGLSGGTVTGNRASSGGGIASVDAVFNLSSTSIDDNTAQTGGGVYHDEPTGAAILELLLVHASGNRALGTAGGGGLYARGGSVTIQLSTFLDNTASAGPGGGLVLDPEANIAMTVSQSTISQNTAATNGGGIAYPGDDDVMIISGSTIDHNRADRAGGGIWGGQLGGGNLDYSTVSSNSAGTNGGGLYLGANASGTIVLLGHSTIADNGAGVAAGGVHVSLIGTFEAYQLLLANSTSGGDCGGLGTLTSIGYTLLRNTAGCNFTTLPTDVLGMNPRLGPLQDNGGPTFTQAITTASPAYNAGDPTNCGAGDQRTASAPAGGACDIGAFEVQ